MALSPEESSAAVQWDQWRANQTPQKRRPIAEWTPGDFAVEHVAWLDATVRNSGWIEVLASSGHGYLDDTVCSLNAMGAHETLSILKRCLSCFPAGDLPDEGVERRKQIEALSDEDIDFLDSLNDEYYASQEDLCALAMKYRESTRRN